MKAAHSIPRIGLARAKGEHLIAANGCCTGNCNQGRDCPMQPSGLLSSSAFWIGGAVCLALWTLMFALATA